MTQEQVQKCKNVTPPSSQKRPGQGNDPCGLALSDDLVPSQLTHSDTNDLELPRNLKMGDLEKDGPVHDIVTRTFDYVKGHLHLVNLFPDSNIDRPAMIMNALVKAAVEKNQLEIKERITDVGDPRVFTSLKYLVS